jgi:hypothetical protein
LNVAARNHRFFFRPAPQTFGLIEWEKGNAQLELFQASNPASDVTLEP